MYIDRELSPWNTRVVVLWLPVLYRIVLEQCYFVLQISTSYRGIMSILTVKFVDLVPPFDGVGDFSVWLTKFEAVASAQKIADRATVLAVCLQGGAFAVFNGLSDQDKADYDAAKSALLSAFSPSPFAAFEEFRSRYLRHGELVDVFAADLRRLASLISPTMDDRCVACAFVCGLPADIRAPLEAGCSLGTMPLAQLVERARSLAAAKLSSCASVAHRGSPRRGGSGASGTCFRCGGERHVARDCPVSGRESSRTIRCFKCNGVGHFARSCPARTAGASGVQESTKNE